jgi:hypothetical protein
VSELCVGIRGFISYDERSDRRRYEGGISSCLLSSSQKSGYWLEWKFDQIELDQPTIVAPMTLFI